MLQIHPHLLCSPSSNEPPLLISLPILPHYLPLPSPSRRLSIPPHPSPLLTPRSRGPLLPRAVLLRPLLVLDLRCKVLSDQEMDLSTNGGSDVSGGSGRAVVRVEGLAQRREICRDNRKVLVVNQADCDRARVAFLLGSRAAVTASYSGERDPKVWVLPSWMVAAYVSPGCMDGEKGGWVYHDHFGWFDIGV